MDLATSQSIPGRSIGSGPRWPIGAPGGFLMPGCPDAWIARMAKIARMAELDCPDARMAQIARIPMASGHGQRPWPVAMANGQWPWPWPVAMAMAMASGHGHTSSGFPWILLQCPDGKRMPGCPDTPIIPGCPDACKCENARIGNQCPDARIRAPG